MPIKYGEVTIIYNKEETTLFTSMMIWLNREGAPPKKSKYVFLFDDGEICDSHDKLKDFNFKFSTKTLSATPQYFEKNITHKENINRIYFYKDPIIDKNNNPSLNFNNLFSSFSKYKFDTRIASIYNSIYYCYKDLFKPEVFGIIRIKSNEYMPRFQFAYDNDEFTKEEIVYLIICILNQLYLQNESNNFESTKM